MKAMLEMKVPVSCRKCRLSIYDSNKLLCYYATRHPYCPLKIVEDKNEPSSNAADNDKEESGVFCYDCRKFYEDDKGILRCKDKPADCISVDPDVCEPCPGFEGALSPRWEYSATLGEIHCPNPACDKLWFVYEDGFDWNNWKHCPHCGKPLDPPREEG